MFKSEKEKIFEEFRKYLREYYRIEDIFLKSNFKRDLGLSSFDFVSIVCTLENKYKITFNPDDYKQINTIEDLIDYIINQRKKH